MKTIDTNSVTRFKLEVKKLENGLWAAFVDGIQTLTCRTENSLKNNLNKWLNAWDWV